MNTIKIYLAESGGIANLVKDFSIYQHSYQNKLLNIFVPTSILAPDFTSQLNGVTTGEYVAGTAVKIGISYTARNGSIKTSESRYLNYIKVLTYQNVEYALFERMLPKEFTLYAGQGANAPILTTNVVNVQTDVEEGETPIVLSIITSQTCNLDVMASTILDNEEVVEASELETINARLNSIDGTLAEKQDITDEALDTTSKTIVGGINELKATSDTHTTQIGDNTEDIAENQNDIDYLYSHMAQTEEYIGQMTGSALPSDSALTDFVVANTDPSRQPKNADVIIFILQVPGGTDKNYKYLFSVTSWNGFEIPPVEQASNGTKGILEGTYSVGLTHNTLVNISGGQILNIYVKDTTGTYRDIREYANTLNTTIQSIVAGDTSVGLAVKSLQDGLGNNIVNTYLTQNAGATKQYVRDYSLPREFNDIYFIASTGYQDTIPTTPESGIQFSGTSSAVGDLTLFQIEKVSVADFELSSKNSSQNTIYVSADRNCSVYFRLSTQAKNIGQDWVDLSVELSNQISLTSGEIYKLTFSSAFSSLGTTVMTLTDNDLIRQTFEVVTQESAETTFDVYSNETYTSSYAMNTQSQVQIIAQGNLGEQPVYEITGELVGGVITFGLDDPTILNNNVEARFVLNYTTATVPEDSTEIVLVLNEQNIRLVTPYNLETGNAIVRYLSQVNNQFTGGVQTWAFKGFIQIDSGDNISIIVDEDDISELQNDVSELQNDVSLKVDKVAGKALSTNDLTNTLKSNYDTAYTNTHTHSNKTILDNTTASYTTDEQTKLSGIANGAEVNVQSDWNAISGDALILNKPTTLSGYGITDALNSSLKGANNGLAELDATGKVPSGQLPSYVDDVIEVANYASLPTTGEGGKIYVTLDTNLTYRWGGTAYVEISPSLALGETSSTAFRGDWGKTAYDHSQLTSGNPHNVTKTNVGLGNVYNPTAYGGISYGGGAGESGVSFTDLNSLVYTGFYTCFGTTANVPSASYSWFIQHINSNVGNVSATQIATAYATTNIIYKRNKSSSTWSAWENISPSLKENLTNKVTSISSSSTDTQYPSAKCVYDIIDTKATKLEIPQWNVPYRDIEGTGEPNTSRFASMTTPLFQSIIIRDQEGKATFVGGTSASQGIVKSQLDDALATKANVDASNLTSGNITSWLSKLSLTTNTITDVYNSGGLSGYFKLSNGIMIQWGRFLIGATTSGSFTLPQSYTNNEFVIVDANYSYSGANFTMRYTTSFKNTINWYKSNSVEEAIFIMTIGV